MCYVVHRSVIDQRGAHICSSEVSGLFYHNTFYEMNNIYKPFKIQSAKHTADNQKALSQSQVMDPPTG